MLEKDAHTVSTYVADCFCSFPQFVCAEKASAFHAFPVCRKTVHIVSHMCCNLCLRYCSSVLLKQAAHICFSIRCSFVHAFFPARRDLRCTSCSTHVVFVMYLMLKNLPAFVFHICRSVCYAFSCFGVGNGGAAFCRGFLSVLFQHIYCFFCFTKVGPVH